MRALKKLANRLKDPNMDAESRAFMQDLFAALDQREKIDIARIFDLNYDDFEIAVRVLVDWRLHHYRKPEGGIRQALEDAMQGKGLVH